MKTNTEFSGTTNPIWRQVFGTSGVEDPESAKGAALRSWDELHKYQKDLRRAMNAVLDRCKTEKRDLTKNEAEAFDLAKMAVNECVEEIDHRAKSGDRNPRVSHRGGPIDDRVDSPRGSGRLRAFASNEDAFKSYQWVAAQLYGNPKAASWCAEHGIQIFGAGGTSPNTSGGFLVPDEIDAAIIQLREDFGIARQECRIRPMGSDRRDVPKRSSGLTAHFVGENTEGTESDKRWTNVGLTARKLMVLTRISSELNEDAVIDVIEDLAEEIALAFAEKEDDCLFNGDGTSTYGGTVGIRTKIIDGSHDAGKVLAASGNDTFAEITTGDLDSLMAAVPNYALRNSKFYVSRKGYTHTFQRLIEAAGGLTAGDMVAGPIRRGYMGYPIKISEKMPTSTGDLSNVAMIVFGDLRQGVELGDRRGIRIETTGHRYFELDQIGVKGTERFDLVAHGCGDNTTPGPIAGLVGN